MLEFLQNNVYNIIVAGVLAVIVFLIIRKMVRDRKSGKGSCGCGCSGDCAACRGCTNDKSSSD